MMPPHSRGGTTSRNKQNWALTPLVMYGLIGLEWQGQRRCRKWRRLRRIPSTLHIHWCSRHWGRI